MTEGDAVKFFTRMQHLFGHKWQSAYGPAMDGDSLSTSAQQWRYDLRGYERDQIQYGLQRLVDERPEWPPGPIDFMNLCDGIPTLAQIMDRSNDYGPVCRAIRGRMDWYNLEGMTSKTMRAVASQQVESALCGLRREGAIQSMAKQLVSEHKQREALQNEPKP